MLNDATQHLVATLVGFVATIASVGVRFLLADMRSRIDRLELKQSEMAATLARIDERTSKSR